LNTNHSPATEITQQLLNRDADAVARKTIEMALDGNATALRLVIERVLPPKRSPTLQLDLGPTDDAEGISQAQGRLIDAVSSGDLAIDDAVKLNDLLESRRATFETVDLAKEIKALRTHIEPKGKRW
jgi:hypothetical protein